MTLVQIRVKDYQKAAIETMMDDIDNSVWRVLAKIMEKAERYDHSVYAVEKALKEN